MFDSAPSSFGEALTYLVHTLEESDGTTIVVAITDDSELRAHAVRALAQRLGAPSNLVEFAFTPEQVSLFEVVASTQNPEGGRLIVSAVGLEALPRDKRTEAIRLLNRERNRFGRTGEGMILWVNQATLAELAIWAADFYSWRSGTVFITPPEGWDVLASQRRAYLEAILGDTEYVSMQGLAPMRGGQVVQMRMDEIFIPLQAEVVVWPDVFSSTYKREWFEDLKGRITATIAARISEHAELVVSPEPPGPVSPDERAKWIELVKQLVRRADHVLAPTRPAEIGDLLADRRAVVTGDPGAGKSTLMRVLARKLAQAQLGQAPPAGESWSGDEYQSLPVYVRIAEYAERLQADSAASLLDCAVDRCWSHQLPLTRALLDDALQQGRVLFLLDGLDEVIDPAERQTVAQQVAEFGRAQPGARVIVTSRIVGYREARLPVPFTDYTIQPFDDTHIARFVKQWYAALNMPDAAESLRTAIVGPTAEPSIRRLASNPLLITVIALIHFRGTKLPNRRVDLYRMAAETLVDQWMSQRRVTPEGWDPEEVLKVILPAVAWRLHHSSPTGLLEQAELIEVVAQALQAEDPRLGVSQAQVRANQFRRNSSEFSGIFLERGLGQYGFLHLTFEEYFAGIALANHWDDNRSVEALRPYLLDPRWTEPILLAAGHFSSFSQVSATQYVHTILTARSPYEDIVHRDLFLAARCLADEIRVAPDLRAEIVAALLKPYFASLSAVTLREDIRSTLARMSGTAQGEVVAVVMARLEDAEAGVRRRAAEALGSSAATPAVVEALRGRLEDADAGVRACAAKALGTLGPSAATPAVVEAVASRLADTEEWVRASAVAALAALGPNATTPAVVEAVVARLVDAEEWVRARAVEALGTLGPSAATPAVVEAVASRLADTEEWVRASAVAALGALGPSAATPAVVEAVMARLADADAGVRASAADALRALGPSAAIPAVVEAVMARLTDADAGVRRSAARALRALGPSAATPAVVEAVVARLTDADAGVRRSAARALGALGPSAGVVEAVVARLADADADVRASATEALGALGSSAATPAVVEAVVARLEDADAGVRAHAAEALGTLGPSAVTPAMVEAVASRLTDADAGVRASAVAALAALGPSAATPAVVEMLVARLADPDAWVRWSVAQALGALGPSAAVPGVVDALVARLGDTEDWVRWRAAEALETMARHVSPINRERFGPLYVKEARSRNDFRRDVGYRGLRGLLASGSASL